MPPEDNPADDVQPTEAEWNEYLSWFEEEDASHKDDLKKTLDPAPSPA